MEGKLVVIDGDGWRIEYPLNKNLIYIGSNPHSDIVLNAQRGGGVFDRHLQLIPVPTGIGYRLINLSDQPIPCGDTVHHIGQGQLDPRSYLDISDGQQVKLGDFTLQFYGGGAIASSPAQATALSTTPDAATSQSIGLSVRLSDLDLQPDRPIEGEITVQNLGSSGPAQFILKLEGLAEEFYELESGPILAPDGSRDMQLRLYHPKQPYPPAGRHHITIQVTSPDAYPGEQAAVRKVIDIVPFFHHTLTLTPHNGHGASS